MGAFSNFYRGKNRITKKRNSIFIKVIFGIVFMTLVLLLGLGTAIFIRVKSVNDIQFTERLSNSMNLMDQTLNTYLSGLDKNVSFIDNAKHLDEQEISEFEEAMCASDEFLVSVSIIRPDGALISYPEDALSQSDYENFYQRAEENEGNLYVSGIYEKSDGTVVFAASKLLYDDEGEVEGVAALEINDSIFLNIFGDETTMGSIKYVIVDENTNMVLNPFESEVQMNDVSALEISSLAGYKQGDYMSGIEDFRGVKTDIRVFPSANNFYTLDYVILIPYSEINSSTQAVRQTVLIVMIIGFIFAVIMSLVIAYMITGTLIRITTILKNISQGDGDLTVEIPVRTNDELGKLSGFFNLTIQKIAAAMKTVIYQVKNMDSQGKELSENMGHSADAIEVINRNINNISTQVHNQREGFNDADESVKVIADNIVKLNQSISDQSASLVQSSASVEEMVANINSVTQILEKNSENVRLLSESADKGRELVKHSVEMTQQITDDSSALVQASSIIRNIARQTNLLSMNASIEAAHAGKAGEGFAVVAEEIRELAENSSSQGKRISDVMDALKEKILAMSESAHEMQAQFAAIFEHTQTVTNQENVIKSAMDEQSAGSKQVIDAMNHINSITSDVKNGAAEMEENSSKILSQMEKLSGMSKKISEAMTEISDGVTDLNGSMQKVNQLTKENQDSIEFVVKEVGKFKVEKSEEEKREIEEKKSKKEKKKEKKFLKKQKKQEAKDEAKAKK